MKKWIGILFCSAAIASLMLLSAGPVRAEGRILWSADWNADGSQIVAGGVDTLWLFDVKSMKREAIQFDHLKNGSSFTVTSVAWHPSRNQFAISSYDGIDGSYDIATQTWTPLKTDGGRGIAWHPTGNSLASSSGGNGHLRIWKADGTLVHDVPRYSGALGLTGVAWSPSGNGLVTVGKYITLRDARGKVLQQITHRPEANERLCLLLCVKWHPSGEFFVVGDYGNDVDDPVIQFWSSEGDLLKNLEIKDGAEVRNIDWNHDGTRLASAGDSLRIWSRDGELQQSHQSDENLWGLSWHPSENRIVTTNENGAVTLWNPDTGVSKAIVPSEPDLGQTFSRAGVTGTFVLYDPEHDRVLFHNRERAKKRFGPASTFKIPNALIALDTSAVKDLEEVIPYGGGKEHFKSWEKDMNLVDAMRASNVAVFHQIAKRIGIETYHEKLAAFDYGNRDPGKTIEKRFWLTGPLEISALEQALFLRRFTDGSLPVSERTVRLGRAILLYAKTESYSIYAKTGWLGPDDPQIGWWVGWVSRGDVQFPFALNIDIKVNADAKMRVETGKECLKTLGLLE